MIRMLGRPGGIDPSQHPHSLGHHVGAALDRDTAKTSRATGHLHGLSPVLPPPPVGSAVSHRTESLPISSPPPLPPSTAASELSPPIYSISFQDQETQLKTNMCILWIFPSRFHATKCLGVSPCKCGRMLSAQHVWCASQNRYTWDELITSQ